MQLPPEKKLFFTSDFHLGIPPGKPSADREKRIVAWLDQVAPEAEAIFLMGDVFDFWFEYKKVVPKGYTRLLGKLAELSDKGIQLHYFTGNHDMWVFNYFADEMNMTMHRDILEFTCNGKSFHIGHGDGLGEGDLGYKFIKKVFANPVCRFLFRWLHPDMGVGLADYLSRRSRRKTGKQDEIFLGPEKERLIGYCNQQVKKKPIDYFIFGHRHLLIDYTINESSRYINLGDWFKSGHYAEFNGTTLELKSIIP